MKPSVARRRDKFESDRQDLIRLLSFIEDPRVLAGDLGKSERRWLRKVGVLLSFDDGALTELFPRDDLVAAEQAYQLLVG